MRLAPGIDIDDSALAEFCRAHGIRRLRLFGSALGAAFTDASDIDLLVDFEPGRAPGLLRISEMELELETIIGRRVDLRTLADLGTPIRSEVERGSRLVYAA